MKANEIIVYALFIGKEFYTANTDRDKVRYMSENLKKYGQKGMKIKKCTLTY